MTNLTDEYKDAYDYAVGTGLCAGLNGITLEGGCEDLPLKTRDDIEAEVLACIEQEDDEELKQRVLDTLPERLDDILEYHEERYAELHDE